MFLVGREHENKYTPVKKTGISIYCTTKQIHIRLYDMTHINQTSNTGPELEILWNARVQLKSIHSHVVIRQAQPCPCANRTVLEFGRQTAHERGGD